MLGSFPLDSWLNKLGLASIQYEPTVQNAAAGELPVLPDPSSAPSARLLTYDLSICRVLQWSQWPRRSWKHRNPPPSVHGPDPAGTSWWDAPGQPRRFSLRPGVSERNIWWRSSFFRGLFLLLTPPPSRSPPTGRCLPPSAPWRRTALPPRWPSSGSPGWIWCHRRPPSPWRRPWCARCRCTRTGPRQRRRTARCWRALLSRTRWTPSPMRKAPVQRKKGPRRRLQNLQKVRLGVLISLGFGFITIIFIILHVTVPPAFRYLSSSLCF